jgi:hypothetical protein
MAQSNMGAVGLTQFIPSTANAVARRLGVSPFTPSDLTRDSDLSIRFGAYYLCQRIADYRGDVGKALIAYNGGGGAVMAFERGYPVKGTVGYRDKILAISRVYKSSYGEWWKNKDLASTVSSSSNSTEFSVTPRSSGLLNVPIIDFWKGLLSSPQQSEQSKTAPSSGTDTGQLNNFWQNLLPGN